MLKYFFIIFLIFFFTELSIAKDDNRSSLYLGSGMNLNSLNTSSLSNSGGLGANANIGYDIHDYVALEFRKGTSLASEEDLLLDDSIILFAKGKYPILNDLTTYILLGYGKHDISHDANVFNDGGFAYGVGAEYKLNTSISLYTDYTHTSSNVMSGSLNFTTKHLILFY